MAYIRPIGENGPPPGHLRGEDLELVTKAIQAILNGALGEEQRSGLHAMLAEQVRYSDSRTPLDCSECHDLGLLFIQEGGYQFTYRCTCTRGLNDPRAFPVWRGAR